MSGRTADCPRRLGARAIFAALAIAALAAAPVVTLTEATQSAKTTIGADPSDVDYYNVGEAGAGGGGGG
jgi:hypothetical protein